MSLLLALVGVFAATAAVANIPDPNLSDVPDMITITPDGSFAYTVTIIGAQGPVNGANVEIRLTGFADPVAAWCLGQAHPSMFGTTDANGQASFNIAGGGCVRNAANSLGEVVSQVFADGIEMAQPDINSPDVVNASGVLYTDATFVFDDTNGDGTGTPVARVGLSDAVFHTGPIANGLVEPCTNFTAPFNDVVALGDAVIVTPFIVFGASCDAQ